MKRARVCAAAFCVAAATAFPHTGAAAQHMGAAVPDTAAAMDPGHAMWRVELGDGWHALGMAQAFPIVTVGAPGEDGSPLRETEAYLTQAALMADVASRGAHWVLRTTLNFEGPTQEDGELTYGGWGEGFIDRRHPHTLLHELVLSYNVWRAGGGVSLSAGKGFAPYGTDDPMVRPGLKYPTNHHLSQILERWLVAGAFLRGGFSIEASTFGGAEPEGPYDFDNIDSFADSWSARLAQRWGNAGSDRPRWEASASFASVEEEGERTRLWNVALRHDGALSGAPVYGLIEGSISDPEEGSGEFSVLVETQANLGRHRPYARVEHARRPEFPRAGGPAEDGFFRYEHHDEPIGATRWWIASVGYGLDATSLPASIRPFVEAQYHSVRADRGGIDPEELFGTRSFWGVSFGARMFFGGGPMRMGSYGVLDPMVAGHGGSDPMRPMGGAMEGSG
ncbi:MAG TPA: hypothetical protein VK837_11835 [Longimicrobiales bacterium]|nr:hypothetical protein [Longimicrobiales bacterium]